MDFSQVRKFEDLTVGQFIALGNKAGGLDNVIGLLQGKLRITLEGAVEIAFDKRGRRILPNGLSANVCDPNREFRLNQPELTEERHFADRIVRLHDMLDVDTGVTAAEFQKETKRLLELIRKNKQTVNIANGVYLPIVCPKLITNDLGRELERYLTAASKGYADVFPKRRFCNHPEGTLDSAVSVIEGSRHGELIERMKQGPVMGIYFPQSLQGFSIDASRAEIASLSEGFILSGLDAVIAVVMYSDVLAYDLSTPGLDLAALSWQSAECSLRFRTGIGGLGFDDAGSLVCAFGGFSGGLLFVG